MKSLREQFAYASRGPRSKQEHENNRLLWQAEDLAATIRGVIETMHAHFETPYIADWTGYAHDTCPPNRPSQLLHFEVAHGYDAKIEDALGRNFYREFHRVCSDPAVDVKVELQQNVLVVDISQPYSASPDAGLLMEKAKNGKTATKKTAARKR